MAELQARLQQLSEDYQNLQKGTLISSLQTSCHATVLTPPRAPRSRRLAAKAGSPKDGESRRAKGKLGRHHHPPALAPVLSGISLTRSPGVLQTQGRRNHLQADRARAAQAGQD